MPLSDAARIHAQTTAPQTLLLWRALQPLRGLVRFMNSGAHPDDEMSGMLAALTYRDGLSVSYVCSTRGEGGQNDIGREAGADLGTLRTAEMERASDVLGLSMYWLSTTPEDPITDFGFSKSGVETLGKWGHAPTLRRLVEVIRADRPDILCPTFLDIPGQHGHHRAMTQAAHEAMSAAADPGFAADGAPWQIAKLYLPAWSGAGDAYDDDEPPPPATVQIPGTGREPVSGWTWVEIGQQSRVFHATQGMGRWVGGAEPVGWPLHLAQSFVGADLGALTDNLPKGYGDLLPGTPEARDLDAALQDTAAAFPDCDAVLSKGFKALSLLRALQVSCPQAARDQVLHRLDRTEAQLCRALFLASGTRLDARMHQDHARPGEQVAATLAGFCPNPAITVRATWQLPPGWACDSASITVASEAPAADPYPPIYHAHGPQGPIAARLTLHYDGQDATVLLPPERALLVLPKVEAHITPATAFVNSAAPATIALRLSEGATITPPEGWTLTPNAALIAPSPQPGLHLLPVTCAGEAAMTVTHIDHPHTGPRLRAAPATLRLRIAKVALAPARIGYIGAGHDRVDHWLGAMGTDVTTLPNTALTPEALAGFDTLVIGIFALRFRPGLLALMPAIHDWTRNGGTLLTLYHRPWDNWDPQTTAPAPLEIGKPSLRYRVTDEAAVVRHLIPDHPLLSTPNRITPQDWQGWVKERGLYFAKSWDAAYQPLLEMADPNEAPHQGALLSAPIGRGQHHHCALILHLQMEALVPGAFRLMANLTAPRR
jgi:LmbE family N-acetylglucosaminyl deacetylase